MFTNVLTQLNTNYVPDIVLGPRESSKQIKIPVLMELPLGRRKTINQYCPVAVSAVEKKKAVSKEGQTEVAEYFSWVFILKKSFW